MSPLCLCLTLIVLNIFDAITTVHGLNIGRTELNHILPPVRRTLPIKIALPFLYLALVVTTSKLCAKEGFGWGLKILKLDVVLLVVLYFAVILNNLIVIFMGSQ